MAAAGPVNGAGLRPDPCYAVVAFGRGIILEDWAEVERWRERFQAKGAEARRFPSAAEARRWLEAEAGVPVVASWHVAAGSAAAESAAGPSSSSHAARAAAITRLSRTPFEMTEAFSAPGRRLAFVGGADGEAAAVTSVVVPLGAGSSSQEVSPTSNEARPTLLNLRHDPKALETAELRLSKDSRFPEFGFELVMPGNVLYAAAKNLVVRPALQQVGSVRGRQAAMLFEALNSDLGAVAVAVRVTSLDMSVCLKQRVAAWRERGGRDAKGKPVADFGVLDSLERLVRERRLAVRVSDAQHAARMARLAVVGASAGLG
jgi:hypothetical protein